MIEQNVNIHLTINEDSWLLFISSFYITYITLRLSFILSLQSNKKPSNIHSYFN